MFPKADRASSKLFISSLVYLKSNVSCISSFTLPSTPHYFTATRRFKEHLEEVRRVGARCIQSVRQLRQWWGPHATWNKQDSFRDIWKKRDLIVHWFLKNSCKKLHDIKIILLFCIMFDSRMQSRPKKVIKISVLVSKVSWKHTFEISLDFF